MHHRFSDADKSEVLLSSWEIDLLKSLHENLDKSISHSTEAVLLPLDTPIKHGSYVIKALFCLENALLCSQELKQPDNVMHTIKYLHYLQNWLLDTSNVTCSLIEVYLVWALAVQVELESVYPMRDIREMVALCCEFLVLGDSELLLIYSVTALACAIHMTHVPIGQLPSGGAIECLHEARM